jgi:uncharacterized protein (PEP-CTERM system associated)
MTITTAKRIAATLPRLAPLAAALMVALPAHAQWKITPSLSLSETYTDNVALQSDDSKRSQWVTEAMPGITVSGKNSHVQLTARASAAFYKYSDGEPIGTRSNHTDYSAGGRAKVIDDLLYVDASAQGGSRAVSAFGLRDDSGNRYSSDNTTNVASWTISPYLTRRFGNFAVATLRYTHDSTKADDVRFGDSSTNSGLVDLGSGRAWRDLGWNLRYARQDFHTEEFGDTSSKNALAALSYAVNRTLKLTATGGYDSYDYAALGGSSTAGASWSLGFDWKPSARTSIDISAGRHFFGKTGSLAATHRSRHTVWGLTYSDAVTNTREQFTLPQTLDTASLFDSMFALTIPDPVARRQSIEAYLRATGLPSSLTENVNFLSNRYFRQKQLQGTFAYTMRNQSTVLSAYANDRIALSSGAADSGLLGSQMFALNDNVRQLGLNAAYSYRLNALTSANAALNATRSRSRSADVEENQKNLRLAVTHRFGRTFAGVIELRHTRGERGLFGTDYKENAISATLSAQL